MEKFIKILNIASSVMLSIMLLMGAYMYFSDTDMVEIDYIILGYPSYLIYPLAVCKIFASVLILPVKQFPTILKQWAYVGLFINLSLAVSAHLLEEGDEEYMPALLALILWGMSYGTYLYYYLTNNKGHKESKS